MVSLISADKAATSDEAADEIFFEFEAALASLFRSAAASLIAAVSDEVAAELESLAAFSEELAVKADELAASLEDAAAVLVLPEAVWSLFVELESEETALDGVVAPVDEELVAVVLLLFEFSFAASLEVVAAAVEDELLAALEDCGVTTCFCAFNSLLSVILLVTGPLVLVVEVAVELFEDVPRIPEEVLDVWLVAVFTVSAQTRLGAVIKTAPKDSINKLAVIHCFPALYNL